MTRFRARHAFVSRGPKWQRVRSRVLCAGDLNHDRHEITAPAWALFWPVRPSLPQYVLCVTLAAAKGLECPHLFTMDHDAGFDARAKRAGEDA